MRLSILAAAILATFATHPAAAQCQCRPARVYRGSPYAAQAGPRVVYAPRTYSTMPAPQPGAPVHASPSSPPASEAGAFLAQLNAWRAAHGRGPVGWDATLASYAAANPGVHSLRAPGSGQCWAGTGSLTQALRMWVASPPHAAILLNCTRAVGASPCASGATCNAR